VVEQFSSGKALQDILERMDTCSCKLEDIVVREQEAIQRFDTTTLKKLADARHACHQELQELETQCRGLVPRGMSLEACIDTLLQPDTAQLQALRRTLHQRLALLHRASEDNRLRLRAAYDVTSGVLQNMGVLETRNTYGPGGSL